MPLRLRLRAYATTAIVLGLMAWPLFRDPTRDSFPLSDFPMFSQGRPSPFMTLTHALAVRRDGSRTPLSPYAATGNREVLQAMVLLDQAARLDPEESCAKMAARVRDPEVTQVELVTSDFDAVAYFLEARQPLRRHVHASCAVQR